MIHPHQGYMAHMPGRGYSWDELMQMYELQMIASHEKTKGRTLHAEEISALSFWLINDTSKLGYLSQSNMKTLMHGLRFTNVNDWKDFKREFKFSIDDGEFLKKKKSADQE